MYIDNRVFVLTLPNENFAMLQLQICQTNKNNSNYVMFTSENVVCKLSGKNILESCLDQTPTKRNGKTQISGNLTYYVDTNCTR